MVLAGKVVEKSALADVGGFGDVFDGGLGKAFLGEETQSRAEEAFTDFGAAPLPPVGRGTRRRLAPEARLEAGVMLW